MDGTTPGIALGILPGMDGTLPIITATTAGTTGAGAGVGTIPTTVDGTPDGITPTITAAIMVDVQAIGQQPVATWDNVPQPSTEEVADQVMDAQQLPVREEHQVRTTAPGVAVLHVAVAEAKAHAAAIRRIPAAHIRLLRATTQTQEVHVAALHAAPLLHLVAPAHIIVAQPEAVAVHVAEASALAVAAHTAVAAITEAAVHAAAEASVAEAVASAEVVHAAAVAAVAAPAVEAAEDDLSVKTLES